MVQRLLFPILSKGLNKKQHTIFGKKIISFLLRNIGRKRYFGRDGYFAWSIKEVSSATIQKYIEKRETSSHHLKVVGGSLKYLYEEMMKLLGITQADLDEMEDVEIE